LFPVRGRQPMRPQTGPRPPTRGSRLGLHAEPAGHLSNTRESTSADRSPGRRFELERGGTRCGTPPHGPSTSRQSAGDGKPLRVHRLLGLNCTTSRAPCADWPSTSGNANAGRAAAPDTARHRRSRSCPPRKLDAGLAPTGNALTQVLDDPACVPCRLGGLTGQLHVAASTAAHAPPGATGSVPDPYAGRPRPPRCYASRRPSSERRADGAGLDYVGRLGTAGSRLRGERIDLGRIEGSASPSTAAIGGTAASWWRDESGAGPHMCPRWTTHESGPRGDRCGVTSADRLPAPAGPRARGQTSPRCPTTPTAGPPTWPRW
jgi:hypothetical protein